MGDALDISKYIEERDDYIMWRLEERLGAQRDLLQQKLCEQEFQRPTNGIFHLKDNEFIKRNGDVIEYITCASQRATILEDSTKIFEDITIPIEICYICSRRKYNTDISKTYLYHDSIH